MTKTKTLPYDTASYLGSIDDIAAYLDAVFLDGNPELMTAALGDIARSKGMAQLARATGLGRESLYKSLSSGGNPEFATVLKVLKALGLTLSVSRAKPSAKTASNRRARKIKPAGARAHAD